MSMRDVFVKKMPVVIRRRLEPVLDLFEMLKQIKNVQAIGSLLPSAARGLILRQGRIQPQTKMYSGHSAYFDWEYKTEHPEMRELYRRAKQNQWDADEVLDWSIDVDPMNPEVPLLPTGFWDDVKLADDLHLTAVERRRLSYCLCAWMLSQFLHGEQGALYAAAQVTESVHWVDGKLYGATQVMDEGRHIEVFFRYIDEKLNKLYVVNDNLFVIIDALMTDSRWDMKFLGMQIMVEGLALGAFGTLYRWTREPLLRDLLRYVIQDEARHVHFGVLALRDYFTDGLSEAERREREDWAFEVALLMKNRFLAHEVYEEWFEGLMSRSEWNRLVTSLPMLEEFRQVMFCRLVPNLRYIGLLTERIMPHYEQAGLLKYMHGASAADLTFEGMMAELNDEVSHDNFSSSVAHDEEAHEHHHEDEHDDHHDELPSELLAFHAANA